MWCQQHIDLWKQKTGKVVEGSRTAVWFILQVNRFTGYRWEYHHEVWQVRPLKGTAIHNKWHSVCETYCSIKNVIICSKLCRYFLLTLFKPNNWKQFPPEQTLCCSNKETNNRTDPRLRGEQRSDGTGWVERKTRRQTDRQRCKATKTVIIIIIIIIIIW